jgi:ATP-binding cassette subfamily F protein 3
MIRLENICLSFGNQIIFDHISWSINPSAKIGLIGRNGAGKSTMLNVIGGTQQLDTGAVHIPKSCVIAHMPQDMVLTSDRTILHEALTALPGITPYIDEYIALEPIIRQGRATDNDFERYTILTHELHDAAFDSKRAHTYKMLIDLGFKENSLENPVTSLSVGWKMRLVLAKLLVQQADFYLFDEPTNHLDLVAKDWFADFLRTAQFGFLLVSHDKYFLDTAVEEICDIDRGTLTCYTGNYDVYLTRKQAMEGLREKQYKEQQKYIKKQTATIERFRAQANKARMAQSMIKNLEKITRIELTTNSKTPRINMASTQPTGKIVIEVNNLGFAFDQHTIFSNASFQIKRGQKVALVAANGTGKSTLLNVIMGIYKQHTGTIRFGHNVTPAFFQQDQNKSLNPHNTIFEEVESVCQTSEQRCLVRGILGAFLFSGEDIYKKIGILSGGEKNRIAMVKILLHNANFLVLDEPTNHLDITSKDILLEALQQFDGTILFVSHDRNFLNGIATHILELTPDHVHNYTGNYDAYLYHKQQLSQGTMPSEPETRRSEPQQTTTSTEKTCAGKSSRGDRKEIRRLESYIDKLETDLNQITAHLDTLKYGTAKYAETMTKISTLNDKLQEAIAHWEYLMTNLPEFGSNT